LFLVGAQEGWKMRESQYIKHWERVGELRAELRTTRSCLLQAIQVLWLDPVPEPIRLVIEGTDDVSKLDTWFHAALRAHSIADLYNAMNRAP
jgi:hypothetical protein